MRRLFVWIRLTPELSYNAKLQEIPMVLLASDYDKSNFLKANDLDGERKFRMKLVTEEDIGTGANKEKKLVVWFANDDRGLVLNKTNNRVLRGAFGDDTAGWANKVIVLFSMMVPLGGKMVAGLRVRIPPPKQASTTTAAAKSPELSSNGQAAALKPKVKDDELDDILESPPAQNLSDELNEEIDF
jgi:hypothetical protein